jgi:uncharacterized protein YndB with AHSA1/START domain
MEPIERQVTLPADLDEVWELLTRPDDLGAWLGDDVVLDPTPGAAGRVTERDGTERWLVVEEADPGRRLAWRWWTGEAGADGASRVEITLSPTDDGTVLRVVERPLPGGTAIVARSSTGAAWSHRLLHLEALLLLAAAVRG